MSFQANLYKTLFGERSRLTLRVPTGGDDELMTFQRRQDLEFAELPSFRPPNRLADTRVSLLILPAQCVALLILTGAPWVRLYCD